MVDNTEKLVFSYYSATTMLSSGYFRMLFQKQDTGLIFRRLSYSEFEMEILRKEYGLFLHAQIYVFRQYQAIRKGECKLTGPDVIKETEFLLKPTNFLYSVFKLVNFIHKYLLKVYKSNPIEYATRPLIATLRNHTVEFYEGFRGPLMESTYKSVKRDSSDKNLAYLSRDIIRQRIRKKYLFNLDFFYTDLASHPLESQALECSVYLAEINKYRPIPEGWFRLPEDQSDINNQIDHI